MTNIFEALRADHQTQRTLMSTLVKTQGASDGRSELFARLKAELDDHADAEEQAFYSRIMAADLTQEKARHSVAEHEKIDKALKELEEMQQDSPAWLPRMKELRETVEHHLEEEEHEVFQMAGKVLTETEKTELATEYANLRSERAQA